MKFFLLFVKHLLLNIVFLFYLIILYCRWCEGVSRNEACKELPVFHFWSYLFLIFLSVRCVSIFVNFLLQLFPWNIKVFQYCNNCVIICKKMTTQSKKHYKSNMNEPNPDYLKEYSNCNCFTVIIVFTFSFDKLSKFKLWKLVFYAFLTNLTQKVLESLCFCSENIYFTDHSIIILLVISTNQS